MKMRVARKVYDAIGEPDESRYRQSTLVAQLREQRQTLIEACQRAILTASEAEAAVLRAAIAKCEGGSRG